MAIFNIVQVYRLACLRLTEQCADMLISIRYEVHEAGDVVAEELAVPIMRSEEWANFGCELPDFDTAQFIPFYSSIYAQTNSTPVVKTVSQS